jgi:hypothetical protein
MEALDGAVYLASSRLTPVIILLVAAGIWFGVRRVTREGRFGYSIPTRVKQTVAMSPESAARLQQVLAPGEQAWEPLAVDDWETRQRAADAPEQGPEDSERWLVLTSARILAVDRSDGAVDVEIPVAAITNLGLAPLPGNFTKKRTGIAVQADMPDGHRRWLWGAAATEAPGWVIKARDVLEKAVPDGAGAASAPESPAEPAARSITWPLVDVAHPDRVELSTGHHLRPIRENDIDLDYPAVMGSRERLWTKYREAWGWPPDWMTYEQDQKDLARHESEMTRGEAFNYAIFDRQETELFGCVYIDPPDDTSPPGTDSVVSWWVVDRMVDTDLDRALEKFVPGWLAETWGFRAVHYHP